MARQPRGFARERNGLEHPAEAVLGLLSRQELLWRLEQLTVAGFSSVPLLTAIPNRTRSDGVDRNAPAPAKQE